MNTYDGRDVKIARLFVSRMKKGVSVIDMHWLIAEENKDVKHLASRHELGLFEINKTLELMRGAGLEARFLKKGLMKDRGLYVGIKKNLS